MQACIEQKQDVFGEKQLAIDGSQLILAKLICHGN
jgi:hypothetical protein